MNMLLVKYLLLFANMAKTYWYERMHQARRVPKGLYFSYT